MCADRLEISCVHPHIQHYALKHTSAPPQLLDRLQASTEAQHPRSQMLTGPLEGRLLKMLVQLSRAVTVLEIGMYTGYSALSMAEALPPEGKVITLEKDEQVYGIAKPFLQESPHGFKVDVRMGEALTTLKTLTDTIDLAFIDANKKAYPAYYEAVLTLLRPGGLMVLDNTLLQGKVLEPKEQLGQVMNTLNKKIVQDERVEVVFLPIRDGCSLVRKKD